MAAAAAAAPAVRPPLRSSEPRVLAGGAVAYTRGTRASTAGVRLATYAWEAPARAPRARVLLVHGFRSHVRFNFLASSVRGLHCYGGPDDAEFHEDGAAGSCFVRELIEAGFDVYAHDHYGHGESEGLKTYFPSFDTLVDDVAEHATDLREGRPTHQQAWPVVEPQDGASDASVGEHAAATGVDVAANEAEEERGSEISDASEIPLYVMAHSMGGAVAILASQRDPTLFDGMCLSSPACEAPPHMVGAWGAVLNFAAILASALLPQTELYPLKKNTRLPDLQALFDSDPFNSEVCVRGRVGREFLRAYSMIGSSLDRMVVPFFAMSGGLDTLVHPGASRRFYKGAASKDKELNVREDMMHNLLTEPGKEECWGLYIQWLDERVPKITE